MKTGRTGLSKLVTRWTLLLAAVALAVAMTGCSSAPGASSVTIKIESGAEIIEITSGVPATAGSQDAPNEPAPSVSAPAPQRGSQGEPRAPSTAKGAAASQSSPAVEPSGPVAATGSSAPQTGSQSEPSSGGTIATEAGPQSGPRAPATAAGPFRTSGRLAAQLTTQRWHRRR